MTIKNRLAYESGLLLDDQYFPGSIARRRCRVWEEHVRPLNEFAATVASEEHEHVPWFDPDSGGVESRVLLLLQDPSSAAAYGSRIISRHNNDRTAGNTLAAAEEAGLSYGQSVHWNVIPWWVQDPSKAPAPGKKRSLAAEARRAARYLGEALGILGGLDTVVLVGRRAQSAWDQAAAVNPWFGQRIRVLRCPHTSQQAWNNRDKRSGRRNSEMTVETFTDAARSSSQ